MSCDIFQREALLFDADRRRRLLATPHIPSLPRERLSYDGDDDGDGEDDLPPPPSGVRSPQPRIRVARSRRLARRGRVFAGCALAKDVLEAV